ncbi:MAG: ABC transporter ATP-binding protein [Firmicutes bacterium]|nr:ABC transporter ATP-binding protein [Bacillota bacterium]
MGSKIILEIKNVTKTYKKRTVLSSVDFEVFEGEIFGFLGPNGAGKTTLIKIICGLTAPDMGDCFICGKSVRRNFEKAIVNVGAFIEGTALYSYMSGMENLRYYASLYGGISQHRINQIVKLVGMTERIKDRVSTYSYGMKQRIGLAQALLHNPKLLILDEPTNGLDANGIIEIRHILQVLAVKEKLAILVSSHILNEMELLCDTIAIVDRGKVLEIKTMDEIKTGIARATRFRVKIDYPNYAAKVVSSKFDVEVEVAGNSIIFPMPPDKIPQVTTALTDRRISVYGVSKMTMSLEEVYLSILKTKRQHTGVL